MSSGLRQYEIMPVAGAIAVRNINATTPNAWEYYQFSAIKSIVPASQLGFGTRDAVTNQRKNPVRHDDLLAFVISFHDEDQSSPIRYNLEEVDNQPGWTNDFAGLEQAVLDINSWVGAAVVAAAGAATEATLISVLNAIVASDQDIEILLVRDTGNSDEVVQQITNYETGVPVVTYKDVNGAAYVPVGPLEYLDPSAVLNLMLTELTALNAGGQLLTEATFVAEDFATEATLAALEAKLNSLGQKASAGSAPVVLSTEQEAILTAINTATANLNLGTTGDTTSVASSLVVVTLKAANTARKSLKVVNDGNQTLYVREGAGATTALYTWKVQPDDTLVIDDYNGVVTGIWNVANGNAVVTETT